MADSSLDLKSAPSVAVLALARAWLGIGRAVDRLWELSCGGGCDVRCSLDRLRAVERLDIAENTLRTLEGLPRNSPLQELRADGNPLTCLLSDQFGTSFVVVVSLALRRLSCSGKNCWCGL
jgi:hypothetical protein